MESLVWVVVAGVARHVSVFADLPPRRRPRAICPECGRQLTLKLGRVRRHHAAHAPGDVCTATRPETALHINCKLAIAEALRAASGPDASLVVSRQCAGAGPVTCDETMTAEWLRGWDEVLVESRVGDSRRPDIVLRRAGQPLGAIEIVVSSAVTHEKARVLAELSLPWIEVDASEQLAQRQAWSSDRSLPVTRASAEREWRCVAHAARQRLLMAAAADRREAEVEGARHTATLRAARVVDVYHGDGTRDRLIYAMSELATDGIAHSARLKRGGAEVATAPLGVEDNESRPTAWPVLRVAFTADLKRFARDEASFTDSPMRWATGDAAANIVEEALIDRVGRDPTPLATTLPRRWFYAREQQRWFLPPEMRDVRWDRDANDAFAAHPAWAKARNAVREAPAPEGSWDTPVFAAKPIGAMFRQRVRSVRRDASDAMAIVELSGDSSRGTPTIVVVERPTTSSAIAALAAELRESGVEAIWISHPLDWSAALADVAWAPAGRDARGRGGVVIDGFGVFTADQFARALAKGDERLSATAVRRRMSQRVERLSK